MAVESDSSCSHGWVRPSEEGGRRKGRPQWYIVVAVVSVGVAGYGATKRRGKDGNRMKFGGRHCYVYARAGAELES